jgi:hypothetical protein
MIGPHTPEANTILFVARTLLSAAPRLFAALVSRRRKSLILALILLLQPGIALLEAQLAKPSEYQVKAAYLSNFGKFVDWPARPQSGRDEPFNICVFGEDPFGRALDAAVEGETIDRAPMVARRIQKPEDATSCRILFIGSTEGSQLQAALAAVGGSNVLTVGESPDFARRGGIVQFVLQGSKVRFEINLAAAQQMGLKLSSELLKLAVAIRRAP